MNNITDSLYRYQGYAVVASLRLRILCPPLSRGMDGSLTGSNYNHPSINPRHSFPPPFCPTHFNDKDDTPRANRKGSKQIGPMQGGSHVYPRLAYRQDEVDVDALCHLAHGLLHLVEGDSAFYNTLLQPLYRVDEFQHLGMKKIKNAVGVRRCSSVLLLMGGGGGNDRSDLSVEGGRRRWNGRSKRENIPPPQRGSQAYNKLHAPVADLPNTATLLSLTRKCYFLWITLERKGRDLPNQKKKNGGREGATQTDPDGEAATFLLP